MIDIRNTIENADELNGEDSIYIFDNKNRMHSCGVRVFKTIGEDTWDHHLGL